MSKSVVEHTDTGATAWTRFASWLVERIGISMIGKPGKGAVTVILPNGRTRTLGNPNTGEHSVLRLNNFKVIREAMQRGTVGFAAAYMNGDIEVDDLTALFRFFLQNREMFENANPGFFRKAATDLHSPITSPAPIPARARSRTSPSTTISAMISMVSGSIPR